jgi:nitrilase
MPLLRQTLYSQNINLYLAPTADERDTWIPLLRTIAIEGRCFVASSNMCVPEPDLPFLPTIHHLPSRGSSARTSFANYNVGSSNNRRQSVGSNSARNSVSTTPSQDEEGQTSIAMPSGRRNSAFTEEGFEIALPDPTSTLNTGTNAAPHKSRRRQSVIDEDGNEIVLCRGAVTADIGSSNMTAPQYRVGGRIGTFGVPFRNGSIGDTILGASEYICRGGSSIVSPFGEVIAGPQWEDGEGIAWADVDFQDCIRGRLDLDNGGSYSR